MTPDGGSTTEPHAEPSGPGRDGTVALEQAFDGTNLLALRSAVAAHGSDLGLTAPRVADLVLSAQELAANAVRHGGVGPSAPGRLRLWRTDDHIVCEVSDTGPGMDDPDAAGRRRAAIAASAGRGLWIVRQLAASVDIASGPDGVTVTVSFPLG